MRSPYYGVSALAPIFGPGNKTITWAPTIHSRPSTYYDVQRAPGGKVNFIKRCNYPSYPNRRYTIYNI